MDRRRNPADVEQGIDASKTTYDQETGRIKTIEQDGETKTLEEYKQEGERSNSSDDASSMPTRDRPIATMDSPKVYTTATRIEDPTMTSTFRRTGAFSRVTATSPGFEEERQEIQSEVQPAHRPSSLSELAQKKAREWEYQYQYKDSSPFVKGAKIAGSIGAGAVSVPLSIGETLRKDPVSLVTAPVVFVAKTISSPAEATRSAAEAVVERPSQSLGTAIGAYGVGKAFTPIARRIPVKKIKIKAKEKLKATQEKLAIEAEGGTFVSGIRLKTYKYEPIKYKLVPGVGGEGFKLRKQPSGKLKGEFTLSEAGVITGRQTVLKPKDYVGSTIKSDASKFAEETLSQTKIPTGKSQYLGKWVKRPLSPDVVSAIRDPRGAIISPRGEIRPFIPRTSKKSVQLEVTDFPSKPWILEFKPKKITETKQKFKVPKLGKKGMASISGTDFLKAIQKTKSEQKSPFSQSPFSKLGEYYDKPRRKYILEEETTFFSDRGGTSISSIKPVPIQRTKFVPGVKTKTKLDTKQKTGITQKMGLISSTLPKLDTIVSQKPAIKQSSSLKLTQITDPILDVPTKLKFPSEPKVPGLYIKTPPTPPTKRRKKPVPPPPKTPFIILPEIEKLKRIKTKKTKKKTKKKPYIKYVPTLYSSIFKLKAPTAKVRKKGLTGLELRPILK